MIGRVVGCVAGELLCGRTSERRPSGRCPRDVDRLESQLVS